MATATETDIDGGILSLKTPGSLDVTYGDISNYGSKTPGGASAKERERKIGHRRVDEKTGTVTYKKKSTSELQAAIQLGIGQSVGGLSSKPERDLLMQDFGVVQSVFFPHEGSNITPAHHYSDFKFKTYAPIAFRYFRELFNIRPDDFMLSLCDEPMTELSNPGAGGSIFYISADDEFIIKTAQHKEAGFLQKLLPGYYMNLNQNPRTLLPKFYGLYCYQCGGKNIRFVVMNNILPSVIQMHEKYDLKGSTYKRKASKSERAKKSPTLKDIDFMELHPEGLLLEKDTYDALTKTIQNDCRVLESFKIMDYSLLVGIHNLDQAKREKSSSDKGSTDGQVPSSGLGSSQGTSHSEVLEGKTRALARGKSIRTKVTQYSTPMESIQAEVNQVLEEFDDDDIPPGGIPAKNARGDRLLIYLGIIDILQCYRMRKKLEHSLKAMITDGDTVSVTRPSFYADRFQKFFTNTVFKKAPSLEQPTFKATHRFRKIVGLALKHSPSKRKGRTTSMNEDATPGVIGARPDLLMGSSTPPPPFSEAIAAGARARDRTSVSPVSSRKGDAPFQRSERLFQTIQQQQDEYRGRMMHSPLSMSESTPTYTEFTEGTPSYTASSPSCSSEVLDSSIPNLPLEHPSRGMSSESLEQNSPSKVMGASSSTEASYYSTMSHLDPPTSQGGASDTGVVTTPSSAATGRGERQKNNSQIVSSVRVHVEREEHEGSGQETQKEMSAKAMTEMKGSQSKDVNSEIGNLTNNVVKLAIRPPSEDLGDDSGNNQGSASTLIEPRISVSSYRSSEEGDTSFSTQTGSEINFTGSTVSQSTMESSESGVTDLSKGDSGEAFVAGKKDETINEVDEMTYL